MTFCLAITCLNEELCREAAVGDPAAWTRVLAALEAVRVATRPRGARTVIFIVQPPGEPPADLPEERLGPICRQGGVERRCVPPRVSV